MNKNDITAADLMKFDDIRFRRGNETRFKTGYITQIEDCTDILGRTFFAATVSVRGKKELLIIDDRLTWEFLGRYVEEVVA